MLIEVIQVYCIYDLSNTSTVAVKIRSLIANGGRLRLKCEGTRAETGFRLSAKRTSPFKSAGASVQSTTGNRGVRSSGSNAGCTMFRGSVKVTGYPLHSSVSPSLPPRASPCAITFQPRLYISQLVRFDRQRAHMLVSPLKGPQGWASEGIGSQMSRPEFAYCFRVGYNVPVACLVFTLHLRDIIQS